MSKKQNKKKTKVLVADFETRNYRIPEIDDDTSVWLWAVTEVCENPASYKWGKHLNDCIDYLLDQAKDSNIKVYYHNLGFDGWFLIDWLMRNGYEWMNCDRESLLLDDHVTGVISKEGLWYSLAFKSKGRLVIIKDSYKLITFSVKDMSKAFGIGECKGDIDYDLYRPFDWEPTEEELDYIRRDVMIVAISIAKFRHMTGCENDTLASCALSWYTTNILGNGDKKEGNKVREKLFPHIDKEIYDWIKKAYHGGYSYVNPLYRGLNKSLDHIKSNHVRQMLLNNIGEEKTNEYYKNPTGTVLDVNSLYPYVMASDECRYPIGVPHVIKGNWSDQSQDFKDMYDTYFIHFTCSFDIKPGKVPCVQIKNDKRFYARDYQTTTDDLEVELTLFCKDLDRFLDTYDVEDFNVIDCICFQSASGKELFGEYVDHWMDLKIKAKKEKNPVLKTIAKLFLNSLYGRFAKAFYVTNKWAEVSNDMVMMHNGEEHFMETFSYLPVGAAITSYAREVTLTAINLVGEFFVYTDTDSIHIPFPPYIIRKLFPSLQIDDSALGKWKPESEYYLTKINAYEGPKRYIEAVTIDYYDDYTQTVEYRDGKETKTKTINVDKFGNHWHVACAGLTPSCYPEVIEYLNQGLNPIETGREYYKKLQKSRVKGGAKLVEGYFCMRERGYRF